MVETRKHVPSDSQRFCEHCGIIKTFRYIKLAGHSRCLSCSNWEAHNPTEKDIKRKSENVIIAVHQRKLR